MKIISAYNYDPTGHFSRALDKEYLVVPEQSMSIREMVQRMVAGLSVPGSIHDPEEGYFDDEDISFDTPVDRFMDLTDLDAYIERGKKAVRKLEQLKMKKLTQSDEVKVPDTPEEVAGTPSE